MLVQYDHTHFCLTQFSNTEATFTQMSADTDSIADHLMWCVWVWWMLESIFESLILCQYVITSLQYKITPKVKHTGPRTCIMHSAGKVVHNSSMNRSVSNCVDNTASIWLPWSHSSWGKMLTRGVWHRQMSELIIHFITLTHYTSWCYREGERERKFS